MLDDELGETLRLHSTAKKKPVPTPKPVKPVQPPDPFIGRCRLCGYPTTNRYCHACDWAEGT